MFRRNFLRRITLSGVGGLATAGLIDAGGTKTVTWQVKGFTCPTCAVGLEVILRDRKGVARAAASYPRATATIEFDPTVVSEASLKSFIAEMGFTVDERNGQPRAAR
ncbi:MAG: heavy-metal-associated domain-containing protein [Bryobacteraceae bacterium]